MACKDKAPISLCRIIYARIYSLIQVFESSFLDEKLILAIATDSIHVPQARVNPIQKVEVHDDAGNDGRVFFFLS